MKRLDACRDALIRLHREGIGQVTIQLPLRDFVLLFKDCLDAHIVGEDPAAAVVSVIGDLPASAPTSVRIPVAIVYSGLKLMGVSNDNGVVKLADDDLLQVLDAYGKQRT